MDIALRGLNQELISYEQKVLKISREHDKIIERCKVLTSKPNEVGNKNLHDKNDKIDNDHIGYKAHEKIKICKKIENNIEINDNTQDGKDVNKVNIGSNKNSTQSLNTSMLDHNGVMQNDEVPKLDLEAPENGFPKWLLQLDLSSADAIKPEKQ